ncbi:Uncharacterized protein, contains GYD domain [Cupriavidus sp. YR651]|uniref:GYD domain-containing protein n=1 Tax=Cupriavidus sp. YR651 TaxID=1855315 RepID=UPI000887CD3D|nr:GYD domain-containing protein [Cupriavidus sp. YR651]SDD63939.1 Uncharacterized protein, contains GYD domain [Cupriavidus sp. YR651]
MPMYLHQWRYKDQQVKQMLQTPQDRAEIVRIATEAFGGTLHSFFYCFGDFDGVAISEYPDNKAAMAALMTIVAQGRILTVRTTPLFSAEEGLQAMLSGNEILFKADGEPSQTAYSVAR